MASSGSIQFRRVHGHVVPIKMSEHTKEISKGVAGIGAGAVIAQVGRHAGTLIHEAAKADNQAFDLAKKFQTMRGQGPLFDHAMTQEKMRVGKQALRAAAKAKQLKKAAFAVRHGSTVAAAAMIGYGAHKILDQTDLHDSPNAKAAVAGAATAAGTFAVRHAYARGLGSRGVKAVKIAIRKMVRA